MLGSNLLFYANSALKHNGQKDLTEKTSKKIKMDGPAGNPHSSNDSIKSAKTIFLLDDILIKSFNNKYVFSTKSK